MQAVVLEEAGGPEAAKLVRLPVPEPGPGEVRVALKAASLNHRELWISRGLYPGMKLPSILGADGAGVIDAIGAGVDEQILGRAVVLYPGRDWGASERYPSDGFCLLGMPVPGTLAGHICVPATNVSPKPAHLSFAQAAALPTAALTAWRAVTVKAGVGSGDKVLVTGIGGGVAAFALIFAHALGAKVWVTSSSPQNIERAVKAGAQGGFDYSDADWGKSARKASGGGFDVVVDGAPAGSYGGYGRAIAMGARVVIYGSTGGSAFTVGAPDLFLRHATIHGTAMGSPADFSAMLEFVGGRKILPPIEAMLPLEDIAGAFKALQGAHFGKVVVDIAGAETT